MALASIRIQYATWVQFKVDYAAGLVTVILDQLVTLAILGVIFTNVHAIQGWGLGEMIVIYGFTRVALGIADAISENIWWVGFYAEDGSLLQYKLRPIGVLFQLMSERIFFERLVNSIIGIGFVIYGITLSGHSISFLDFLSMAYFVGLGVFVYLGLMVIGAAISIFFIGSKSAIRSLWSLSEFSKFPSTIYGITGSIILTTILPLGMIGYYPTATLIKPGELIWEIPPLLLMTAVVSIFWAISILFWSLALRFYEGTGT